MELQRTAYFSKIRVAGRVVSPFDRLVAWICDPECADGAVVTEQELSQLLEIGRTPLREVLNQAQMIGLIHREPNRSIEIPPLSLEDMEQLSVTRELLEALIARIVTQRHLAKEISIEPLERTNRRMRALADAGDMELLLEGGLEFHAAMRDLSGNAVASRLLDQVMIGLERYRRLVTERHERGAEIVEEHDAVLNAIRAGEAEAAANAARYHIAHARQLYHSIMTARERRGETI